MTCRAAFGWCF